MREALYWHGRGAGRSWQWLALRGALLDALNGCLTGWVARTFLWRVCRRRRVWRGGTRGLGTGVGTPSTI